VITREGEFLCIEVVGSTDTPISPTAILIRGKGSGARTDVKDFRHPDRKN
jgi:hypothetical protein